MSHIAPDRYLLIRMNLQVHRTQSHTCTCTQVHMHTTYTILEDLPSRTCEEGHHKGGVLVKDNKVLGYRPGKSTFSLVLPSSN